MVFQLDSASWTGKQEIGLFKIRLDYAGELLISLKADNTFFAPSLRFQWLSTYLVEPQYSKVEDAEWTSDVGYDSSTVLQSFARYLTLVIVSHYQTQGPMNWSSRMIEKHLAKYVSLSTVSQSQMAPYHWCLPPRLGKKYGSMHGRGK